MRPLLYILSAVAVMGLAFWAYRQNYATQKSIRNVAKIQSEIGRLREDLAMQQAEWAYENRPARLRELALLNFDSLGLLAMTPEQFGKISDIAPPAAKTSGEAFTLSNPVETSAETAVTATIQARDPKKAQTP